MDSIITETVLHNWKRKLAALVAASIIWIFVNHSIIETKIIPNVQIRILNLPADKTIVGLLPNGYLGDRVTLTLSGTKDVVQNLEQGDLEIHLDANHNNSDEWVVQLSNNNLISLNPSVNLNHHISKINHTKFIIKLSKLVTEQIPINIRMPIGSSPDGYEYLDVWPQGLIQTLSGPAEEIDKLRQKGLKLTLNLNRITENDLEEQVNANPGTRDDEITYVVPKNWKQVAIPFHSYSSEDINDPEAEEMRIEFLKKRFHQIEKQVPIQVFYPIKHSETLNPNTLSLALGENVELVNGLTVFSLPIYIRDVSKLFLDLIRDNIEIVIVVAPKEEREVLLWSVEVIDPKEMEDTYIAYRMAEIKDQSFTKSETIKNREDHLRKRFREYMHRLTLYTAPEEKLHMNPVIDGDKISITQVKK